MVSEFRGLRAFMVAAWFTIFSGGAARSAENPSEPAVKPQLRVLFIGNSLTIQNNLPGMLRVLAEQSTPPMRIEVAQVAVGGCTLEKHWNTGKAQKKIQEGGWDYVVLQEHSSGPCKNQESMFKHARLFDAEIKKINARTLLYMTWALQKTPLDQSKITQAYDSLGKELGDTVVPVGIARLISAEANPDIKLFVKDGKHPTPAATYLAACAFFNTITGHSPKGLPGKVIDPLNPKKILADLTPEESALLQTTAESTVKQHAVQAR